MAKLGKGTQRSCLAKVRAYKKVEVSLKEGFMDNKFSLIISTRNKSLNVFVNVVSWGNRSEMKFIKHIFIQHLLPLPFLQFQTPILSFKTVLLPLVSVHKGRETALYNETVKPV